MRRVRVRVSGEVQGVFYRATCAERAERLGLSGWVRNMAGGGVEAAFEGDDGAIDQMIAWCREGPPHAHVERVQVVDEDVVGASGFRITR